MDLLYSTKLALRIGTNDLDDEVQNVIDSCLLDLKYSGIKNRDEVDPLINRAVIVYAKANFGFNEDSEKYQNAYNMIANKLALIAEYNTEVTP